MSRKVFVLAAMGILVFSMVSVSAHREKATIHVQTCGYEGRSVVTLHVDIAGEDSDFLYIDVNAGVLNRIHKEINIELLPIVQINDTTFAVPKTYLREIEPHEFITVVPNNVVKMKWSIKDRIKPMNGNDIVRVLVWFKDPEAGKVLNKFGDVYYSFLSGMGASMDIRVSNIKSLSEEATIEFVEAEGTAHVMLSDVVSHINADDVWLLGYDGTGIKICFVDTGIDANHCDFPSGKIIAWADYVGSSSTPYDDHGHGTHVSSIAAGAASPYGVAKGASIMGAKVCNSSGSCTDTAIIQGIDFGVAQGADVENLSLAGPGGDGTSAIAQECNWAVNQGVVVCVAAGNNGSCCTIGTPGDAANVITVAACDKSGALASFSSRGPTTDNRVKPDVCAIGVSVYAADSGTSCSDVAMSGTSMATPVVSGVCALMLDARGTATPLQVKNCLGYSAIDKGPPGKDALYGWGCVDALAAVNCILYNPNVSPPGNASDIGCACECLGTTIISILVFLGAVIRQKQT